MELVLASRSPRRRELLALSGLRFQVVATPTDETRLPGEAPPDYARRLSREKAEAAASLTSTPSLLLAADTIVVDGNKVLGKPRDAAQARSMLIGLRGHTHYVYTGVTLLDTATHRITTQLACSPVPMRPYTEEEVAAYVATGDPYDKAGAYAIQHAGFRPAEGFHHCFANVMGLPLCHISRMLRDFGVDPPANVPAACQRHIGYECPVFEDILAGKA